jgi:hypothetical protein
LWGIYETNRRFDRPSLLRRLNDWFANLRRAVLLPPHLLSGAAVSTLSASDQGLATVVAPQASATTDQRLAALEAEVGELGRRLSQFMTDSNRRVNELRASLVQETAHRTQADNELRTLIESQAVGGLYLEVMGLVWILAGILAGSFPSQIISLLPAYPC